ncbi:MAG: type IX secretion system membrane protein PorP/SprF [Cytophagales bacterium]
MKKITLLFLLTILCSTTVVYSQDPQLSLFYAFQPYLNPAFAGGAHHHRTMMHFRNQWPSNEAKYTTYATSFDTYFAHKKVGLGGILMYDNQGFGTLNTYSIDIQSSYEINLDKKWTLRPGLSLGIGNKRLADGLTYSQQFTDITGFEASRASGEAFPSYSVLYPTVGAGGVLYSNRMWVGISGKHLNYPNISFLGQGPNSKLPANFNFHAGYKIPLVHEPHMAYLQDERDISVTPVLHYKAQGKSDQSDAGVYLTYDQLLLGIWYRGIPLLKQYERGEKNNESFVFMGGWNIDGLTISYAYDATISKLTGYTAGAHEINLTYIFQKKHKHGHPPLKVLPCPNLHHPNKHH